MKYKISRTLNIELEFSRENASTVSLISTNHRIFSCSRQLGVAGQTEDRRPSAWGSNPTLGRTSSRNPKSYQRGEKLHCHGGLQQLSGFQHSLDFQFTFQALFPSLIQAGKYFCELKLLIFTNNMPLPQLLVGKVAAITGGLTGIGRVSCLFSCASKGFSHESSADDYHSGNCP